ncbi:MAG: hypothetical protein H5T33_06875 [Candidatus Methanosuratus sp.]|nr:hypothetical protein [Candidatus Methanosuratincola sp.]
MFQGQKVDQILGNPILIGHAAYIHNRTLYDFAKPALGVELMLNASQSYGTMPNLQWIYAVYWCEDFGEKIRFSAGRMSATAIESPYRTREGMELRRLGCRRGGLLDLNREVNVSTASGISSSLG